MKRWCELPPEEPDEDDDFEDDPPHESATVLGGLWELECAWHIDETNLRCARISGICMPSPSIVALIVSEISAFIQTDGHG